jgi:hypothetical protein
MSGEGYDEGYQFVPVNRGISPEREKGFFEKEKKSQEGLDKCQITKLLHYSGEECEADKKSESGFDCFPARDPKRL